MTMHPLPYDSAPATSGFGYGLHHVQLCMPPDSEAAARAFYVDILGFVEVEKPPVLAARGGLWVRADRLELHLGVEQDFRPSPKSHPGVLVSDLDALDAHLGAHGVPTTWDDNFPGMRRFYIRDPFGNRIELLQRTIE